MRKYTYLLVFILLLASALRLSALGNVPPSPDWDEASLGYNAYSILKTGNDEYGKFLPVVLRSFDDYKPALYIYFTIPSIIFFGVNTFAVRLPSAIFGILTVFVTYLFVRELFGREITIRGKNIQTEYLALLSAFVLAISPWHIQFSRIAFESNVGMGLNLLAAFFFLKGLKSPWFLLGSAFVMGINIYMYQSEKVFTPLLLLVLVAVYIKQLQKIPRKYMILSCIVGFITVIPMGYYLLTNTEALSRARGVSVFADQTAFLKDNAEKILQDKKSGDIVGLVLDNRRVEYGKAVLANYISHMDLNWLFITGDIARHHAPGMGLLYLFELPFLFLGMYFLLFERIDKKIKLLLFLWLFITPIPASVTSGVPHAVRALNFLPILQIITALGLFTAFVEVLSIKYKVSSIPMRYFIFSLSFLLFLFNFLYYLNQYFVQQNFYNSLDWQYGYEKAIPEILKVEGRYKKIIVSNQAPLDQSYIFFLFYLLYPPGQYQKEALEASGGFREDHQFGKYEFRPIRWESEEKTEDTLYIGRPGDFPDIPSIKTIYYLDNTPAIKIVSG